MSCPDVTVMFDRAYLLTYLLTLPYRSFWVSLQPYSPGWYSGTSGHSYHTL